MTREKRDDPRCDHKPGFVNRVTSLPNDQKWKTGMALRAVWVCDEFACVLDAMAWVERGTGMRAIVYGPFSGSQAVKGT